MKTIFLSALAILSFSAAILQAQNPTPVVVQAAPAAVAPAQAPAQPGGSSSAAVALLQQMQAANEETLKKQQAALQQLEELQKAADQIRIYSKRS